MKSWEIRLAANMEFYKLGMYYLGGGEDPSELKSYPHEIRVWPGLAENERDGQREMYTCG